jgi:UDP-N-acetyl-D-galactosamine dehydrogenase
MFVANKVIKLMINKGHRIQGAKALILGVTFKENCPDIRNSRVIDIYNELKQFGLGVDVYDPHADTKHVEHEYGIRLTECIDKHYDAIILAVSHKEFLSFDFKKMKNGNDTVIFDTKACLDRNIIDGRL